MSQLFTGGQSTRASASVLPVNIQGWFLLGLTGLIFLQSKRLSIFSSTTVQKHLFFGSAFFMIQLSHLYMTTRKAISSVQFSRSVVSDSLWPHELQHARLPCASPSPEFTQTHVHPVGDAIQPSHPWSSPFPLALNPSSIRVFSNESTLHMRWPKYWSFSFI